MERTIFAAVTVASIVSATIFDAMMMHGEATCSRLRAESAARIETIAAAASRPTAATAEPGVRRTQNAETDELQYKPGQRLWPIPEPVVTSEYGMRKHPITKRKTMHQGIDLRADLNDYIYSSLDGQVKYAGWIRGYGKTVEIYHPEARVSTLYAHLNEIAVEEGTEVKAGQKIGYAGTTGASTGVHLHFGVKSATGDYIPPISFLESAVDHPTAYLDHPITVAANDHPITVAANPQASTAGEAPDGAEEVAIAANTSTDVDGENSEAGFSQADADAATVLQSGSPEPDATTGTWYSAARVLASRSLTEDAFRNTLDAISGMIEPMSMAVGMSTRFFGGAMIGHDIFLN